MLAGSCGFEVFPRGRMPTLEIDSMLRKYRHRPAPCGSMYFEKALTGRLNGIG